MKMYQFVVLTGLISTFSLLNFYDRWQYFNMGQQDKKNEKTSTPLALEVKQQPMELGMDNEKIVYLSKLYMALGEISTWYIQKKSPQIKPYELTVWKNAVFAKADQEKLWEQFFIEKAHQKDMKKSETNAKKLTYSSFKQLGFLNREDKAAWKFLKVFIDGMENYHFFWEKAAKADCVAKGDVMAQARAAFSSYSGGMTQLCRWSNAYSKVSDVDRTFFKTMKEQSWKEYGTKTAKVEQTKQIVKTKVEKVQKALPKPSLPKLVAGEVVQLPNRQVCVMKSNRLQCLNRASDLVCLSSVQKLKNLKAQKLDITSVRKLKIKKLNRFETCENFNPELRPVSSLIKTKKKIKLRSTPGGKFLSVVPKGVILRVKDYKIESIDEKHTYYKVSFDGKNGYIYAGTEKTAKRWISTVSEKKKTGGELAKLVEKFRNFLEL